MPLRYVDPDGLAWVPVEGGPPLSDELACALAMDTFRDALRGEKPTIPFVWQKSFRMDWKVYGLAGAISHVGDQLAGVLQTGPRSALENLLPYYTLQVAANPFGQGIPLDVDTEAQKVGRQKGTLKDVYQITVYGNLIEPGSKPKSATVYWLTGTIDDLNAFLYEYGMQIVAKDGHYIIQEMRDENVPR